MVIGKAVLVKIGGVDDRLDGEKLRRCDDGLILLVAGETAGGFSLVQMRKQSFEHLRLMEVPFISFRRFDGFVDPALHHLHVGKDELQLDDFNVPQRICSALHVDDVFIVEAAHHMNHSGRLPDIGQKFVAKSLSLGSALHQARDVHKFHHGGGSFLGVIKFREPCEPQVGDRHHTHIGIDGAERIVRALGAGARDGVK
ncbi:hypothetical protein SDC9_65229 [bioreactor metagenome]|uniref:Uncharacterized protein n=1 Tax=bioreactor metagenome TaxID=1076179 RepID=A0A644XX00_9ZZZZ